MRSNGVTFRSDIEGLRGVAVLLVVLFHAGVPGFGGGFAGVDVFFVLSGYLITGLLVREVERTGRIALVHFYARRVRRLLPAAVLVLLATLAVSAAVFSPLELAGFVRSAVATSLYASNIGFLREATDYFGAKVSDDPFLHTWSLAVEEQFYLLWPVLIAAGLGAARSHRRVAAAIALVTVGSLAGSIWFTWSSPHLAFFASPLRAWEFGIGGLASLVPPELLRARPTWSRAAAWTGLALIVLAGMTLDGERWFPGPTALLPVLGTVAALAGGVGAPGRGPARLLGSAPFQSAGRLSYSWYLWHWPVLVLARAVMPDLSLPGRLLCAGLALGLAAATYAAVERPVRGHPWLAPRAAFSLGLGAVLTLCALSASLGARQYAQAQLRQPDQRVYEAATLDRSAVYRPECITPSLGRSLRACVFGDPAAPTTVALLGDSHAAQWFPDLLQLAETHHWRLVSFIKPGCPVTAVAELYDGPPPAQAACAYWMAAAVDSIVRLHPAAAVLASSLKYIKHGEQAEGEATMTLDQWETGMHRILVELSGAGVRTVLLRDSPRPGFDVPTCLSRMASGWEIDGACRAPRATAVDARAYAVEQLAAWKLPGVTELDLTDLICGPVSCDPVRNGTVVYRDADHLTAVYASSLIPQVEARLEPLVQPLAVR